MDIDDLEERIEEFKHKHESNTEWNLRKTFMLTHREKYPLNRLVCLAACFINYECYGCTYPGPVMVELKDLMEEIGDVLEEHRTTVTQARQLQFVKDSGENFEPYVGSKKSQSGLKDLVQQKAAKRSREESQDGSKQGTKKMKVSFVKASDSYSSTDVGEGKSSQSEERSFDPWLSSLGAGASSSSSSTGGFADSSEDEHRSELLDKFYTLKAHLKDCLKKAKDQPVSALHMAADKAKLMINADITPSQTERGKFDCLLQMDFIDIATATANNKKNAKNNAYVQAIDEFKEPYLKIEKCAGGKQVLEGSQAPFSNEGLLSHTHSHIAVKAKLMESGLTGVTKLGKTTSSNIHALAKTKSNKRLSPADMNRTLEEFLIVEHHNSCKPEIEDTFVDTNVLRRSADFNKMSLEYDFRQDTVMGESRVRCLVSLEGNIMAEVEGISQQNAKHLASTKCMEKLRQVCWTIQIKQAADSTDLGLSRDQVLGDLVKTSEAIPESNIGNKLLKAMGWKGGGMGKTGTGIAEPVSVEGVINREGLGLKSEQGVSKNFYPAMQTVVKNYAQSSDQNDLVFSPDFTKDERASIHKICQQMNLKTRSYGVGGERYLVASRRRTPNQLFNHILESGGETSKYVLKPPCNMNM